MKTRLIPLLLVLCVAAGTPARAGELVVAAASDLTYAIREIASSFEKQTGHTVRLTLGSSGNFHAQIANGAPFDIFLSADVDYIRRLEKAGLIEPGTVHVYAVGRIVLWTPQGSPIDVRKLGMQSLLHERARKIAIANPEHAPYGRAAIAAMERAGVYTGARSKLVLGENISQAAQFVQSGAADIGILALSLALGDTMNARGRYWEVPLNTFPQMDQAAVILRQARSNGHLEAARAFMEMLHSPAARSVLQKYGFTVPTTQGKGH